MPTSFSSKTWCQPTVPKLLPYLPCCYPDWSASLHDLNPTGPLWSTVKRKMSKCQLQNKEELKAVIKATWPLVTSQLCHKVMAHHTEVDICGKGVPTK